MPHGFGCFRRFLCGIIALTAAISMVLAVYLSKFFMRQGIVWLLVGVQLFSFLRATWSAVRKPMFRLPQSVASETVGLFVLLPFQLIIVLLMASMGPKPGRWHHPIFLHLRIFSITSASIHILYTVGLVAVSMLTVPAYDADVWLRDIDSVPSPFPSAIIFAYICPCVARHFAATRDFVSEPEPSDPPTTECLPTCLPNCTTHNSSPRYPKPLGCNNTGQENEQLGDATPETTQRNSRQGPPVLPRSLVRLPNAAERRASIYVDLPLGDQWHF
ncbi:hypothetical protein D9619_001510 [Psilocybe cf. subviscida]|uniref:Uncharacterized protein n=1 Tax=Psilocybe cf. subviscida TaxID=2480587 RepID=A0A8H5F1V2_9AGAR|nr:hypothetical protein D9619_001510 [Psilocybe cf. subviscida]